jgi:hypothetical protein
MAGIFNGAAGFGALQNKEYSRARDFYLKSDLTDLQNVFQLALAELEMNPQDIRGFWHAARAVHLAQSQNNVVGARQIEDFGKAKYKKYHGSLGGWDELMSRAKEAANPPHGFTVSRYAPPAALPQQEPRLEAQAIPASANRDLNRDAGLDRKRNPCDPASAALPRVEHATPGGVPASSTSFGSDSRAHGVPASVSSPVNGQFRGVPASVTSPTTDCMLNGVVAGIESSPADAAHGVPASVTSPMDGRSHGVPASVASPVEGQPHGVPASVTSIGVDGSLHGIPASALLPAVEPPLLLVIFGDLDSPEVEVMAVPLFGAWRKMAEPGPASQKRASLKRQPPGHPTERKLSAAAAMAQK